MPFSRLVFACCFLPLCLFAYWAAGKKHRNTVALAFSLAFYAWGAPRFLPVIFALGVIDFWLARAISVAQGRRRKLLLAAGVSVHVSVLAYFKYSNFFVGQLSSVLTAFGATEVSWTKVVLPIGVSFLTFEEISYLVDVYRADAPPARRWTHYLLFLMLFPHSIAGPIFRWKDMRSQFDAPLTNADTVLEGLTRFSFGLAKKVLVADSVAVIADGVFGLHVNALSAGTAWAGALAYTIQIYFDFSGYSDMAIGLGKMLGFTFKENFREPYVSLSITEFWKRWHISLSSWMRDYLYVPLGGNRHGSRRTMINTLIVFAVSGLWHGAAWTFLAWGVYHGVLVVLERRSAAVIEGAPRWLRALGTFTLVVVGWVPFRAGTLRHARDFVVAMFGAGAASREPLPLPAELFPRFASGMLAATVVYVLARMMIVAYGRAGAPLPGVSRTRAFASVVLLAMSVMHMTNMRYTPLIYFKF